MWEADVRTPNNEYLEPPSMGLWCLWIEQISTTNNHYWGRFSSHPKVKISKFAPDLEDINPKLWLRSPLTSGFFVWRVFQEWSLKFLPLDFWIAVSTSYSWHTMAYLSWFLKELQALMLKFSAPRAGIRQTKSKLFCWTAGRAIVAMRKIPPGVIWGRWTTSAWRCKRKRRHVKVCSYPVVGGANDIGNQL